MSSRVIHFEIHADDPERASKFYTDVFDWIIQKMPVPGMDYWLIKTGSDEEPGIDGGLMKRKVPVTSEGVMAYVCTLHTDSVDEVSEKVTNHGGQLVVSKMPVPGVGWLAYCKDTEGNVFGVMQDDPSAK